MKIMELTVGETDFILTDKMSENEKELIYQQAMKEQAERTKKDHNKKILKALQKELIILKNKENKCDYEIKMLEKDIKDYEIRIYGFVEKNKEYEGKKAFEESIDYLLENSR